MLSKRQFSNLWFTRKVSDELVKVINYNKNLQEPHVFWAWLINLYSSTITLEICKLIDDDKQCVSLMILLNSLKKSEFLTESNFLQLFKQDDKNGIFFDIEIKEWYKKQISVNGSENANEMIEKDIVYLKQSTEKIRKLRDTVIAHLDKKSLNEEYKNSFNFDKSTIDEICLLIETLIQKYNFFYLSGI